MYVIDGITSVETCRSYCAEFMEYK